MNIFSIHTNDLDRREVFRSTIENLKSVKILVLYRTKLLIKDRDLLNKKDIPYYRLENEFWKVQNFEKKYDLCIVMDGSGSLDNIQDLNIDNLLLLRDKFEVPRELSKKFDVEISNISSFERKTNYKTKSRSVFDRKDEYLIREDSEFTSMTREQIITFITREVKLNLLLG